jgi:adenine-specific DNA glycosylase
VCKARKPECPTCVVADLCHYKAKTGPAELIAARAAAVPPAAPADPPLADPPLAAPEPRRRRRRAAAMVENGEISPRRGRPSRPA